MSQQHVMSHRSGPSWLPQPKNLDLTRKNRILTFLGDVRKLVVDFSHVKALLFGKFSILFFVANFSAGRVRSERKGLALPQVLRNRLLLNFRFGGRNI